MRTVWILCAAVLAAATANAQDEALRKKLEKKLASPFLKQGSWFTDYEAARGAARKERRVIFGYFTRSFSP